MSAYSIFPIFILMSFLHLINGQSHHSRNFSLEILGAPRGSKSSFDAQFQRGRCPEYFYQLGEECVHFSTAGKIFSWDQAERLCAKQVARVLRKKSSLIAGQLKTLPAKGVRQFLLNTPEKTKILEALYRDYDEMNYAVRLPSDFNTLHRCRDGKEDHWPQYCHDSSDLNATCFETSELGSIHFCLRQTDCDKKLLRLACEFTLPGSEELTSSTFRHCPKVRGLRYRLSVWAWLLIFVGAMLLLLLLLGGVLAFIRNLKKESLISKKSISETRQTDLTVTVPSVNREDQSTEPMLVREAPSHLADTGYQESQSIKRVTPSTVITKAKNDVNISKI